MTKHSEYSELEVRIEYRLASVALAAIAEFVNKQPDENEEREIVYQIAKNHAPEFIALLTTYLTKEKAKAELAARFKYEPAIAHAIGYCRGLGHPESYLEKQFPELAQLTKEEVSNEQMD